MSETTAETTAETTTKTCPARTFVPESPLRAALDDMAEVLGSAEVFGDGGTTLTCTEANAIALVMHLSGHTEAGVYLLAGHAEGDDGGDPHAHLIADPECDLTVDYEAGRDYLQALAAGDEEPELRRRCERCSSFFAATVTAIDEGLLLCPEHAANNDARVTV
jgi:hypothetical protein